jgi:hypothetical protein
MDVASDTVRTVSHSLDYAQLNRLGAMRSLLFHHLQELAGATGPFLLDTGPFGAVQIASLLPKT